MPITKLLGLLLLVLGSVFIFSSERHERISEALFIQHIHLGKLLIGAGLCLFGILALLSTQP